MQTVQQFFSQFSFDPARRLYLGVEVEYALVDPLSGLLVPQSPAVLSVLRDDEFTYELSACQVEHRAGPVASVVELRARLARGQASLRQATRDVGLVFRAMPVAPEGMSLAVYPDERYVQRVVPCLSRLQLEAACRVMGTHIHVGVGSAEEALAVYQACVRLMPRLLRMCGSENMERLRLYRVVAPKCDPPLYASLVEWYAAACALSFADDPRNCWHLIRISRHGTVELRLFPATANLEQIACWAVAVQELARGILA